MTSNLEQMNNQSNQHGPAFRISSLSGLPATLKTRASSDAKGCRSDGALRRSTGFAEVLKNHSGVR